MPVLFDPIQINNLTLQNRIVMSPMTRSMSPGGIPSADVASYYSRRAAAGVGLIVTEGIGIDHPAAIDDAAVPVMYGDALQGWRDVVKMVHTAGGKIVPQLWHQGPLRMFPDAPDPSIIGARPSGYWGTPGVTTYGQSYLDAAAQRTDPMSEGDIVDIINAFARAARTAIEIGFDGIAIHGAHGYLIDAFLWDDTNQRQDQWGGTLEKRTRFAVEVIRAVRAAIGPDKMIMMRLSQHKQQDYKARLVTNPDDLGTILGLLSNAGVDLFDMSARRFYEPHFAGSDLTLAGWAKKLTGKPVMAVGDMDMRVDASPERAADLITAGEFDLIGVGRALLHDPLWASKLASNQPREAFNPASLSRLT